ncbi:MAG: acyltransferase [Pseudomonas sp.]|uniref:acyltransferase family protein n=1 Tax=Pseudomonas sp. TaxID=306 RepID=UPI0033982091
MSHASIKNLEIEYLRAVSIGLVLLAHSPLLSPFVGEIILPLFQYLSLGVGVDLFFCISGFVVSRAYCDYFDRHAARGEFWPAARMFWLRRAYRLLPSAWFWVLVGLFCSLYFNSSGIFMEPAQNLKSALAIASLSANVAHMYGALAPNNVYWSLSLEEQFYLLFPLFLLAITARRWRIIALLVVIAGQFFLSRNHFGDMTAQYLASFRIDGFAWGILVHLFSRGALYRRLEPTWLARCRPAALAVTLLLVYLLTAVPARLGYLACHMGLMAMVAALLLWLASYGNRYLFGYVGPGGLLGWLGSRSYGIYLIHLPAFKIVHEVAVRYLHAVDQPYGPELLPYLLLGALGLIGLLAEFNFRCIETPLRKRGAARAQERLQALEAQGAMHGA